MLELPPSTELFKLFLSSESSLRRNITRPSGNYFIFVFRPTDNTPSVTGSAANVLPFLGGLYVKEISYAVSNKHIPSKEAKFTVFQFIMH